MEKVILVDTQDNKIGTEEKIQAHRDGKLHRAFSVFIFNTDGKVLLQQRAKTKYHSPGLWTNTCCGHPRPDEETKVAAKRRLYEEMGIDCDLKEMFSFIYKVKFDNGLFEHEYDHVFFGTSNAIPKADPEEVHDWKWVSISKLKKDLEKHPEQYTYWLKTCIDKIVAARERA